MNSSWKPVIIRGSLVTVLWLTGELHSASHSFLHMSSAALSSVCTDVRGGCLSSYISCGVQPVGWAAQTMKPPCRDWSMVTPSWCLVNKGTSKHSGFALDFLLAWSPAKEHRSVPSVFPFSDPVTSARVGHTLWMLWQMETEITPQTHPLAHRGARAPLLSPLASYFMSAQGQKKLERNHREIKFGIIKLYWRYQGRRGTMCA